MVNWYTKKRISKAKMPPQWSHFLIPNNTNVQIYLCVAQSTYGDVMLNPIEKFKVYQYDLVREVRRRVVTTIFNSEM